jgi:prepilin-type N-terminal cleavage/methylation domain-containing protein
MTPAKTIKNLQKGFTLIELLVVIGILAILLAIVLIAINPAKQFGQANDTKRASDVNAVLNAVNQYMADNKGQVPAGLGSCTTAAPCDITTTAGVGNINLCPTLVTKYIADLPTDPTHGNKSYTTGDCTQAGATYDTAYQISVSATDNRITVQSPAGNTYSGIAVTVTR